jgi:hypothetical protein
MKATLPISTAFQQSFHQAANEKKKQNVTAHFTFPSFAKFNLCMFDPHLIFYYISRFLVIRDKMLHR